MRVTLTASAVMALLLSLAGPAAATVHTVDDSGGADFTTIGEAIAVCVDSDTVLVYVGTYTGPQNRGIVIDGMNIAVIGADGHLATTIDCEGQDRAFDLAGAHDTTTVFRGLSIVNGNSTGTRYTSGGAILMFSGAPALVEDCYFGDNTASDGGAISIGTGNVARIRNCVFDGNSATLFGGAINCNYDHSVIRGCEFADNTAPEGGAVRVYYSSTMIVDCFFGPGNAGDLKGGAIIISECRTSSLVQGCTFTGNSAPNGGGIYSWVSTPTIEDCYFGGNAASDGGGLSAVAAGQVLNVAACRFEDNTADNGGGAEICGAPFVMTDCTFSGNQAQFSGGGLYLFQDLTGVIGCTFSGNEGAAGAAGGIHVQDSPGTIANTIVAFSTSGAGVVFSGTSPEIRHSCIFANAGGDSLPGYHHDNMFLDPLFCDMGDDDFTLCANSFCLQANNIWFELIGAHGQGCAECGSPAEPRSWGSIKALYR
jgi:predicted outer membrane repeat protein